MERQFCLVCISISRLFFTDIEGDNYISSHQKMSDKAGGFTGVLGNSDYFGQSVAGVGDVNGDGIVDVLVGADGDNNGGSARGAVYMIYLQNDGTVLSHQKMSDTAGGFTGVLDNHDCFGYSVAGVGDVNGDGMVDVLVGAHDDDGGYARGAVYMLFSNPNFFGIVCCLSNPNLSHFLFILFICSFRHRHMHISNKGCFVSSMHAFLYFSASLSSDPVMDRVLSLSRRCNFAV